MCWPNRNSPRRNGLSSTSCNNHFTMYWIYPKAFIANISIVRYMKYQTNRVRGSTALTTGSRFWLRLVHKENLNDAQELFTLLEKSSESAPLLLVGTLAFCCDDTFLTMDSSTEKQVHNFKRFVYVALKPDIIVIITQVKQSLYTPWSLTLTTGDLSEWPLAWMLSSALAGVEK